ncbi:MAG: ABC transporter permease [Myxococcota bacterium]
MRDVFIETWRSIVAHRVRFGLTALGIAWGGFMLTFLSANMMGFEAHFVREFEEIGPRVVHMGRGTILKARTGERGARTVEIENEDVQSTERLLQVEAASPEVHIWSMPVRAGRRSKLLKLTGLDHDGDLIRGISIAQGRFLSPLDVERRAKVAVVGPTAAERLFGHREPVGEALLIDGQRFRIVGITKEKGEQLMNSGDPEDLKIFVPYTTAQRWFTKDDEVDEFAFAPTTKEASWDAIRQIRELTALREGYDPRIESAMWAFNIQEPLDILRVIFGGIRVFMISAGLVTLFVGAVGVMNIMLVVVGERTQEIGVRKAIGARGRDVFIQFLLEATLVAIASGAAGAGLGMLLVRAVEFMLPEGSAYVSPPLLDPATAIVLTGALAGVGIVAGLVPAIRASRIPPAEALRAM